MSDVIPTSYHCVHDTGVKEGDVVGVWVSVTLMILDSANFACPPQGLGPIGQCVIRWAKLRGASRVIGIDCIPERLKFAKEHSGAEVVDFSVDKNVPKKLSELVPGGLDVALDCGALDLFTYIIPWI